MKGVFIGLALVAACSGTASDPSPAAASEPATAIYGPAVAVAEAVDPAEPPGPPVPSEEPFEEPSVASVARELAEVQPEVTAVSAADSRDAVVAELHTLSPDPAPEHTTNDVHYLVSNERRLDLFRPELDDLGGVMLGVGSDQNYVMAAWSRTELLVIVDFDQQVVDLHGIHGALMAAAPTVDEYRRLWSEDGADDARAAITDAFDEPARHERLALYDEARTVVDKRLRKLARRYTELGIHSYLDTPEEYRFVADLHAAGRVVALRGDFTREGLLREVARVLEAHSQALKVLYLSNIEQYFTYREPFKANMLALPFDDHTVVLRTLPGRPVGFHYILQRGADFHTWMRTPKVWSVYRIRGLGKGEHLQSSERFVAGPPPAPEPNPVEGD
ncbi:LIC_10091 family protein [Paraliomyxa miuraensis]|uniref:LIC_10091 family protein n=1 Tax=Paraliomyxa miuraensis TaxID=376150 RepID=UPI00224F7F60|nr:hypothetical protein [Paraliomyxa miuraensis]MCX4241798.1 hypothetical protein [Paraliomyxa miuraensis]